MEINVNTPLSDILNSDTIAEEVGRLERLANDDIETRLGSLSSQIRSGGLNPDLLVDGQPVFYEEGGQLFSDYLILSSSILWFTSSVKSAAVDKEIEELRKLKNLLARSNDHWQLRKQELERECNELARDDTGNHGGGDIYLVYYGDGVSEGKITKVQKYIDDNNDKIEKINIRLGQLGYSSSSSSGGSYSAPPVTPPSEDYIYGEHGYPSGSSSSSSGGSSSSGSDSSSSSAVPTPPSEDYVYGEHGSPTSS